ncbi:MAG TPA: RNA methyltransferase [Thermomicrobiales bacterium]|nr:RNA methyltransferase [Thermomicrobiales bacterium]
MRSLERRRYRQAERAFLVEGRRLAEEALRMAPDTVRLLLVREDVPSGWWREFGLDASKVRRVDRKVFEAASGVEHAQGVAAVCDLPVPAGIDDLRRAVGPVLVLDRLRDPGNVGTALRSAAAAGAEIVLTTPATTDSWSPKVVRAGMGAHFRLRIGAFGEDAASFLRETIHDVVCADASALEPYHARDWRSAAALIIGGETEPLSAELETLETHRVRIPMRGGMESLNAGVAASVLLFEAQRQGAYER